MNSKGRRQSPIRRILATLLRRHGFIVVDKVWRRRAVDHLELAAIDVGPQSGTFYLEIGVMDEEFGAPVSQAGWGQWSLHCRADDWVPDRHEYAKYVAMGSPLEDVELDAYIRQTVWPAVEEFYRTYPDVPTIRKAVQGTVTARAEFTRYYADWVDGIGPKWPETPIGHLFAKP
ncbi:MAG: hypothetical protein JST30_09175 [Armatimonadetes bacterium]|nr:hypothetical protein [Armatimonadota bacterium]